MKKTQKRIFGFFGLAFVVAMTFLAAMMPTPGASATTTGVTDQLVVKVINEDGNPHVKIISPTDESVIFPDSVEFAIDYNSAEKSFLDVTYIGQNDDGTDKEPVFIKDYAAFDLDFNAGVKSLPIDLEYYGGTTLLRGGLRNTRSGGIELGYGEFIFALRNIGIAGVEVPGEQVSIIHSPFSVSVNSDEEKDGSVNINVDYETEVDPDTGDIVPSIVDKLKIEVRDPDSKLVYGPIYVSAKGLINKDGTIKDINLPFGDFANKTGDYKISVTAYDQNGEYLYTIHKLRYYEVTPVPDTGMFFQNLSISKEDYLITGLIVFFIFAVVGFAIVAKNRKSSNTRKR